MLDQSKVQSANFPARHNSLDRNSLECPKYSPETLQTFSISMLSQLGRWWELPVRTLPGRKILSEGRTLLMAIPGLEDLKPYKIGFIWMMRFSLTVSQIKSDCKIK